MVTNFVRSIVNHLGTALLMEAFPTALAQVVVARSEELVDESADELADELVEEQAGQLAEEGQAGAILGYRIRT